MTSTLYPIKKALVSVYDKRNLDLLGLFLKNKKIEVYSTGGTADFLRKNINLEITAIESVTSFPEMMDGRVKTLHPKVFGGILARRQKESDLGEAKQHQIPLFDLVVVNLYPFWDHLGKSYEEKSSFIDIGGPAMIRAAAKNSSAVTVLSDPCDYEEFIEEVEKNQGTTFEFRHRMAGKAFARTAKYDAMIAEDWEKTTLKSFPSLIPLSPVLPLRYGENPHQKAGWASPHGKTWEILQGKELSYNNLLDVESAVRLAAEFLAPTAVIVKHGNPCGVASGNFSPLELFKKALSSDSQSAFGGVVAFNRPVDDATANQIAQIFLEVIVAPGFSIGSKEILAAKKNLRLIEWPEPVFEPFEVRSAMGGWLVQELDDAEIPFALKTVTTTQVASDSQLEDLKFAWKICKHVRSNAIVIAKEGNSLGIGAGQMSRVDAVKIALQKCEKKKLNETVLASDAFFPFRDNIDLLKNTGVSCIIQPGGSQRDLEVIQACNELGIAMVFTGTRHFRH